MNPMREIRLEKVTINIGAGEAGPKLETAKKLLEKLSGSKVVITKTHKRSTFGVAKKRPIGVKITMRGEKAKSFLTNVLKARENKLNPDCFDDNGNFSLGIKEYIDLPGIKYDPEIGIIGMDVCVTLERPGFRIKKRGMKRKKVGMKHRINKEEAKSRNIFIAGWRPFVGWTCGLALFWHFLGLPVTLFITGWFNLQHPPLPEFDMNSLMTVLLGMLGLGGMRSFEKFKGLTK